MESLQLYVKNTANCEGLPLQTFDLLGPTWQGDSVTIPFIAPGQDDGAGDGADETLVTCEVTGWTDLFMGRPCPVKVAWARRLPQPTEAAEAIAGWPDWQRSTGILVWGGNSGVRVTGPGAYADGYGMPIMWLEDETLLPVDVRAVIRQAEEGAAEPARATDPDGAVILGKLGQLPASDQELILDLVDRFLQDVTEGAGNE